MGEQVVVNWPLTAAGLLLAFDLLLIEGLRYHERLSWEVSNKMNSRGIQSH